MNNESDESHPMGVKYSYETQIHKITPQGELNRPETVSVLLFENRIIEKSGEKLESKLIKVWVLSNETGTENISENTESHMGYLYETTVEKRFDSQENEDSELTDQPTILFVTLYEIIAAQSEKTGSVIEIEKLMKSWACSPKHEKTKQVPLMLQSEEKDRVSA